ncbi:MAG: hypothetical protein OEV08_06150, partial [Nitrospira sp.]|nr:hypothetical protein [Nitrospira sp.]
MLMQPFNEKKPASLSPILVKILSKPLSERTLQGDALAQAVISLSRLFTTDRSNLAPRYLDDPAHADAYRSYFMPVNLSKVQVLLDELPENSCMGVSDRPMAVLDLGCGPGTGSLALLDWLWHRSPDRARSVSMLAADSSQG